MPYYRRRAHYNRRHARRPNRTIKRYVNARIRKNDNKNNPVSFYDVHFNDYVPGNGFLFSFGQALENQCENTNIQSDWPTRGYGTDAYKEGTLKLIGCQYQFRFKQNEQDPDDVLTNAIRLLCYSTRSNYQQRPDMIVGPLGIDSAPNTLDFGRMYMDRVGTLKAAITETDTDESQFVPGQMWMKGSKKFGHIFRYNTASTSDDAPVQQYSDNDVRFEMISDDNNVGTIKAVEVFGFVRVYYRVIA